MKNLTRLLLLTIICIQFIACNKSKDYIEMIPADADFVVQINTKSIAQKGKFDQIEHYEFAKFSLDELNNAHPDLKELIETLKKSPNKAGLDLISPIYIFGKKINNQVIVSLTMNMNDKSDFEQQLKTIYKSVYQKEIEFETENDYTFIAGQKKPYIAWNKKHFLYIAGEYGASTKLLDEYFVELIKNEKQLLENNGFAHFIKNSQDINFWCTGNFLNYFSNKTNPSTNALDFSKSSWSTFISFTDDQIQFTQKFHPDTATKVELEKRPMWKDKINTDMYKFFPAKSYFNLSFAAYQENTRYLFDNKNVMTEFLKEMNINEETFEKSFSGEVLFSIYDFEKSKSFDTFDYFEKNNAFKNQTVSPQYIFAGKMKDEKFYNEIVQNLKPNLIQHPKFIQFKLNHFQSIYFSLKHNILYATNNLIQINNFVDHRVDENNFLHSAYALGAKNSMFINVDLDFSAYPLEVQEYILNQFSLGNSLDQVRFLDQFSKFSFQVTDEYTKTGTIELKKNNQNSLETILKIMDQTFSTLTNPNHASN